MYTRLFKTQHNCITNLINTSRIGRDKAPYYMSSHLLVSHLKVSHTQCTEWTVKVFRIAYMTTFNKNINVFHQINVFSFNEKTFIRWKEPRTKYLKDKTRKRIKKWTKLQLYCIIKYNNSMSKKFDVNNFSISDV